MSHTLYTSNQHFIIYTLTTFLQWNVANMTLTSDLTVSHPPMPDARCTTPSSRITSVDNKFFVFNTLRPWQNGRRFADDTFKRIFLSENARISIAISLNVVPKGPINYNPA